MDTNTPKDNCASCSKCHWWSFNSSVTGQCKRYPPAVHFEDGHYWPVTGRGDWCEEFKPTYEYKNVSA